MDEYFEYLVERAQYYKQFEFFRIDGQEVQVGLNRSEQLQKEITVVELILSRNRKNEKRK